MSTAAAVVKAFLRTYAKDIINPRYVQQQLFHNMQQQLCTSRVGHRIIASSIHILSQLLQLDRLRELHRVHFFGDGQVISRVLQKIALANKHEHTPTPPALLHLVGGSRVPSRITSGWDQGATGVMMERP